MKDREFIAWRAAHPTEPIFKPNGREKAPAPDESVEARPRAQR